MLEISRSVADAILAEAAGAPEQEICGLLFGEGRIDGYRSCRNVAERPEASFEIDPVALIAAYRAERGGGARIVGCYHSHPSGNAWPSMRDAEAAAANDWAWVIVGQDGLKIFRAVDGGAIHRRFDPVEWVPR